MSIFKMLKFIVFLVFVSIAVRSEGLNPRKLDDETPPDFQNKCGNCPCNNPCNQAPPPPPPPSPPPPPKIKPPSNYCPPPPSGGGQYPPNPPYIYVNGPPGNMYPVDPYYSGAGRSFSLRLPFFISTILGILAFI
ncbi:leucine-rich repeat extensin-like protein 3 [Olea europaea var. sylvestris]|uniref:leucine-rich repeat extensin-like protein 3 n=1 Tax=Olea europaea var. sylvestris TaxID=158386 RepID=UPI000C1CE9CA|nr:leucine-rich repeat extensin-like protein 3 [Olea europaea var. sylvestris]